MEPMTWEPPNGLRNFVAILQRVSLDDGVDLLRLAFDNAGADAVIRDLRTRNAAPRLLAACKAALDAIEHSGSVDWRSLTDAIAAAEPLTEQPRG